MARKERLPLLTAIRQPGKVWVSVQIYRGTYELMPVEKEAIKQYIKKQIALGNEEPYWEFTEDGLIIWPYEEGRKPRVRPFERNNKEQMTA